MSSKGQGLSLNTIVIAAIVLVVLLIIVGMTTGYFGKWTGTFKSASDTCQGAGGQVIDKTKSCSSGLKESTQSYPDVLEDKKCCVKPSCGEAFGTCKTICNSDSESEYIWAGDCGTKKCCVPSGGL